MPPEQTARPASRPSRTARIERIFDHAADTRSLFLAPIDSRALRFTPGQFISIVIPLAGETRNRAYSIASSPDRDREADGLSPDATFEICFNRVPGGRGVDWLFERVVGDTIDFTGPFGAFTLDTPPSVESIFLADATAIAPIRPMVHRAASSAHAPIVLIHAAYSADHLLYQAEFEDLAGRDSEFRFEKIIAPEGAIYDRLFAECERRWIRGDSNRARRIYICGVGKGVIRLRDLFRQNGYERRSVLYEQW